MILINGSRQPAFLDKEIFVAETFENFFCLHIGQLMGHTCCHMWQQGSLQKKRFHHISSLFKNLSRKIIKDSFRGMLCWKLTALCLVITMQQPEDGPGNPSSGQLIQSFCFLLLGSGIRGNQDIF